MKQVLQALNLVKKFFVVLAISSIATSAIADTDWPKAKNVTIYVAFAPGAFTDVIARIVGQELAKTTGGNFVVENKPGAGGNIATQFVKRAPADGYSILVHSVAYAVNPSLYPNAGYDAIKAVVPLALGPRTPNIITVNPKVPAKDLKELVELAKKEPLSYASSGIGTTTHLSMERLKTAAKVDITHVPYQPAQAVGAAVAGHTQISSTSMPPAVQQIKAGNVRAIAVTSSKRSSLLPDVPSVTEFGYKDFDDYTWVGFFVPVGTPPAVVEQMNAAINRAMETPEAKEKFALQGMESTKNTSAQFGSFLQSEVKKWAAVVVSSGAKVE